MPVVRSCIFLCNFLIYSAIYGGDFSYRKDMTQMLEAWQISAAVITAVITSSGFWVFIMKRMDKKSTETKLLLGLACDRIVHLGMTYINRGWITKDEYETLHDYLWIPYRDCGGDGTAERVMNAVEKLEIRQ